MLDAPVGFAFGAGMVAAFNPCGFALLPAYLSLFLAGDGEQEQPSRPQALARAGVVSASVVAGFVLVFGIAGLLISQTSFVVQDYTPWLTVIIGVLLVPVGIAMMRGWTPKIRLPAIGRSRQMDGSTGSMFVFGVSYAVVSLSCTIPAFLVAVVGTFSEGSFLDGLAVFAAYTAGMGSVLVVLTVVVATAQQGMLAKIRGVLPYVSTVAGLLAAVAGAYVAYYGIYEIRLERGDNPSEGPIGFVGDLSGDVTTWVNDLGTTAVSLAGGAVAIALIAGLVWSRRRGAPSEQTDHSDGSDPTDQTQEEAVESSAAETTGQSS